MYDFCILYAPINVKPQGVGGGGGGQVTHEKIDWECLPLGRDFWRLSVAKKRKCYPRGGKLTFSRCLGVGNLTLASIKVSNSPGSAPPPPTTLGLNIDRCITNKQLVIFLAFPFFSCMICVQFFLFTIKVSCGGRLDGYQWFMRSFQKGLLVKYDI